MTMDLKGYTNIPDWMLSLDLDVYETIILAVIYGFSQDGDEVIFVTTEKPSVRFTKPRASKEA